METERKCIHPKRDISLSHLQSLPSFQEVSLHLSSMRCEERIGNPEKMWHDMTVCLHSYSDLSHVSPAVFVYLLKECYVRGTRKATLKFRALQQQVLQALHNAPQPGPSAFIVQCLYILPLLGSLYTEGFSHLLISSLRRLQTLQKLPIYSPEEKRLAVKLFLDALACFVVHEERILLKLLEIFDIGLEDIGEVICGSVVNGSDLDMAKACVEQYIFGFIESQSYMTAVSLLERFSIRQSGQSGQSFLLKMLEDHQYIAAEKWATFMGKPMLCVLVQKYIDMKKSKNAYDVIKKNNLKKEFPDVYHLYKESSLKKLAEKGCWDIAEIRTNSDRQLVEYLVYLAMEAGYTEKVDELCERYSLEEFSKVTDPPVLSLGQERKLQVVKASPDKDLGVLLPKECGGSSGPAPSPSLKRKGIDRRVIGSRLSSRNPPPLKTARTENAPRATSLPGQPGVSSLPATTPAEPRVCPRQVIIPVVPPHSAQESSSQATTSAPRLGPLRTGTPTEASTRAGLMLGNPHVIRERLGRFIFPSEVSQINYLGTEGIINTFLEGLAQVSTASVCLLSRAQSHGQMRQDIETVQRELSVAREKIIAVEAARRASEADLMATRERVTGLETELSASQERVAGMETELQKTRERASLNEAELAKTRERVMLREAAMEAEMKAAQERASQAEQRAAQAEKDLENGLADAFIDGYDELRGKISVAFPDIDLSGFLPTEAPDDGHGGSDGTDEEDEEEDEGSYEKTKASSPNTRYLHLTELGIEDIIWVDKVDVLLNATIHIEGCKVVGIDCEWKPNYVKGSKPNKVSIMQIASERKVFIIDLLKLSTDEPNVLDSCLKRILSSPRILKLGYNLQCDLQQLSHSYGDLECFKYYEMLLDIQKLFKQQKGGLSGLAKKILGAGLNKTRRNSNWEQRPLSQNQMEYAALDAAVLIHIFHHLHGHPQYAGNIKEQTKVGWKSHIVSRMGNTKVHAKASN